MKTYRLKKRNPNKGRKKEPNKEPLIGTLIRNPNKKSKQGTLIKNKDKDPKKGAQIKNLNEES